MNFTSAFSDILQLLAGIGIFLVAREMMSDNLEAISSEKLKKLFSNVSDNRIISFVAGLPPNENNWRNDRRYSYTGYSIICCHNSNDDWLC